MNKKGPIIVIEDDEDDRLFINDVFHDLNFKNEILFFENGQLALNYLMYGEFEPFIIICDINMPVLNGMDLKEEIQKSERLRVKCIPYLFFTTSANQQHVNAAYDMAVQGFFIKPYHLPELKSMIKKIVEYWQVSELPRYVA
jgi:CheY-like chemotaxis protein